LTSDSPKARLQGYGFRLIMGLLDGQLGETLKIGELLVGGSAGLGPMEPIARVYGATLLGDVGRPDEAVALLRPALDAEVPDPLWTAGANAQMALLEARRGNLEASSSFLERAREQIEDMPSRIRDRWETRSRGAVLLARGDSAAAVPALKRATELSPEGGFEDEQGLSQLWFDLAKAYLETGQDVEAEPWLRRLAEAGVERLQAPIQYVRSLYLLAELLERRGQTEEARDLYQRFLDHWGDGEIDLERVEAARERLSKLEAPAPTS
jgi:tetratricopeptide (TPR) repeat protein